MDDVHETRSIRTDLGGIIVKIVGYLFIGFFALCCLLPFLLVLGTSFTSEAAIKRFGFNFWPREFSTFAYKIVFENPDLIIGSYLVTIGITICGTALGLFLVAMTGYALQRPDFAYRNRISFFIYFTTLFSGGLVPFYLLVTQYLGLKDNYLAVLLPGLLSPFLIIMMKSFVRSIPHAITESAKIDGAGDFTIFIRLILPMTTPALATIGLFIALGYWNEWYNSMLFLSPDMKYRPLQLFLYNVITSADFIRNSAAASNVELRDVPLESMKMATAIVATGPVILFYPFVQRYFIKGITVGAVKG
ncbi:MULTISPECIES: carbohydrate ABC transporter permease [Paenibacillus]|jgi:putative aldouronate transport system permease protein|uniref:Multiple sugar transport system permease n=2 Tax=Paenibacillus barengoltzii TaxID=343517 RepID=R9LNN4_9BACL|nr:MULTISPECIES: ABC transporter permease subunit [Paenibacillus]EOS57322.1 multiple sugar transport system permease [Paenibacillus barengoltzii G22]MDU0328772.1 carbohydrate ABC transporter permease [Paenibacillus sp. 3LSP]MEC2346103.1 carbohydrate ABC transporter permease [Paenibacillus barengoltzii]SME90339.1 putative aldouronate transport system permease protein [Paenibacillus barengoltzii]SMF26446.1 putative aldouronate transport system permease protein [Paenibacillus barengoltzii J12]